jgi:hypothetical protein
LKGAVGKSLSTLDTEKADSDLGIVENRAEELLVWPKIFLRTLAHGFSLQQCRLRNYVSLAADQAMLARRLSI